MDYELNTVLKTIKSRKVAGLDKIPPQVWKTRKFDDRLLRLCNAVYKQKTIDPWERYESPYPSSYGLNSTTTVLLGEWLWH